MKGVVGGLLLLTFLMATVGIYEVVADWRGKPYMRTTGTIAFGVFFFVVAGASSAALLLLVFAP